MYQSDEMDTADIEYRPNAAQSCGEIDVAVLNCTIASDAIGSLDTILICHLDRGCAGQHGFE